MVSISSLDVIGRFVSASTLAAAPSALSFLSPPAGFALAFLAQTASSFFAPTTVWRR
jgi:hypothetical protein